MAENEAWSSVESEPENKLLENLFEDAHFYLSIKDFKGSFGINPNISFAGNRTIDFFNYFCDSSLLQKIIEETNERRKLNTVIMTTAIN